MRDEGGDGVVVGQDGATQNVVDHLLGRLRRSDGREERDVGCVAGVSDRCLKVVLADGSLPRGVEGDMALPRVVIPHTHTHSRHTSEPGASSSSSYASSLASA
eukprot:360032-Chlamydomonas_euryale.AAC.2